MNVLNVTFAGLILIIKKMNLCQEYSLFKLRNK